MWKLAFRHNYRPTFSPTVLHFAGTISCVIWMWRHLAAEVGMCKPPGGGSGLHNKPYRLQCIWSVCSAPWWRRSLYFRNLLMVLCEYGYRITSFCSSSSFSHNKAGFSTEWTYPCLNLNGHQSWILNTCNLCLLPLPRFQSVRFPYVGSHGRSSDQAQNRTKRSNTLLNIGC
jgi:hypothetical protein